ncbi:hypothetical protein, partial [Streptomyces sp. SID10115]|uniref:hypothetical protein n=1 Tax=Streptomyces sp. SID10115 TaxID=2706016 RepID=UPI0019CF9CD8
MAVEGAAEEAPWAEVSAAGALRGPTGRGRAWGAAYGSVRRAGGPPLDPHAGTAPAVTHLLVAVGHGASFQGLVGTTRAWQVNVPPVPVGEACRRHRVRARPAATEARRRSLRRPVRP